MVRTLPLDEARARATAPDFTQVFHDAAPNEGPLAGLTVAVKDLFDVAGYKTRAGSVARDRLPPATADCTAVARLRAAGAALVGHANMTEFAYSGVGLNPHFGTPLTPLIEGAIAGGSTSGGASAVARGLTDVALGTDTGGSLRIPAAFCGLLGFKPTASEVPRDGVVPLSHSLDAVGAIARDPVVLRRAMEVLRGAPYPNEGPPAELVVPENFGLTDLEPEIAAAFNAALSRLETHGYRIVHTGLPVLERYRQLPVWHFSAVESRVHHAAEYTEHRSEIDPRVAARMARADEVSAPEYARTLLERNRIVAQAREELGSRALVLPTVAMLPPQLSAFEAEGAFDRLNLLALRNTTLANVIDGCSVALPLSDTPGAGLMLTAAGGLDAMLVAAAEALYERIL